MSYREDDNHSINTCECEDVWLNVLIRPKTIDCIFIGYAHNNTAY